MVDPIKVALTRGQFDERWIGGVNYFRSLVHALECHPEKRYKPVLIVAPQSVPFARKALPSTDVIGTDLVHDRSLPNLTRTAIRKFFRGRDVLLELWMRTRGIRISSHGPAMGRRSSVGNLCWIPDFQQLHFPCFFTEDELWRRKRGDTRMIRDSHGIIVSSNAAKNDLLTGYENVNCNIHVLNFVPSLTDPGTPVDALRGKYNLPDAFLFLPNHFWAHKNHEVVINALGTLKNRGTPLHVVCSGATEDRRDPDYFPKLMTRCRSSGGGAYFHVLGVVPYSDIIGLMKEASAVINPSLFEGWSTSVEEAKLLGKKIVLSDIPVHREQNPRYGYYFHPSTPESCADQMLLAHYENKGSGPLGKADIESKIAQFGERFVAILDFVSNSK